MKRLKKGALVRWRSHGSVATGSVLRVITRATRAGGRQVKASTDEPQYLVRSDASSGEAVHKAGALTPITEKQRKRR